MAFILDSLSFKDLLVLILGGAVSWVISWYFYTKGPSAEKQKQILRVQQKALNIQVAEANNLKAKFPLGYILFATSDYQIIPLTTTLNDSVQVDWNSKYSFTLKDDFLSLHMPDLTIKSGNSTVTFVSSAVELSNEMGAEGNITVGIQTIGFKVLSLDKDNILIAMGLK